MQSKEIKFSTQVQEEEISLTFIKNYIGDSASFEDYGKTKHVIV